MSQLSVRSQQRLAKVHPDLVKVVALAIQYTKIDFMVNEGVRTLAMQKQYVAQGKSQTMASRHLPGKDGLGHAVDLVALIGGKPQWELNLYCEIAMAVARASQELKIPIRWGACWKQLSTLTLGDGLMDDVLRYSAERRAQGQKAFIDAPHFELPIAQYP